MDKGLKAWIFGFGRIENFIKMKINLGCRLAFLGLILARKRGKRKGKMNNNHSFMGLGFRP
jgi:hypothetical protein